MSDQEGKATFKDGIELSVLDLLKKKHNYHQIRANKLLAAIEALEANPAIVPIVELVRESQR